MTVDEAFDRILDHRNRANPYPLYADLRRTPVARLRDGTYVVSTYREITALLHDPRISSDPANLPDGTGEAPTGLPPSFIRLDPPDHDQLRRLAMRHFGPPHTPDRIDGMQPQLREITDRLIDGFADRSRVDLVDDFAYPFPVTAICALLGVPREDEPRFHTWADAIVEAIDPAAGDLAERRRKDNRARAELAGYLATLIEARRRQPGDDLLSGLATDHAPEGPMSLPDLLSTAVLLLIAGHETTVNLIANGMLTLLRHPDLLVRLRGEPTMVIRLVEELLRYEPPVQYLPSRAALDDIEIAGTHIPKGSQVRLMLAAGSRDPARVHEPERFDPGREQNEHFGFGGGVHYCFGAPLARVETYLALTELARRLDNPRLVTDPPPYRPNSVLRGPRHLLVDIDGVRPA
ncbi:cytochrome P450 [Pseudonocardia acidicola]|uniref:Cytochrome P450 n=1 Tax=Pseudonocardia acidicola TaxID=2724939 RepID=A0ABX1SF46_9PSEU|nr:cytochrome P450 [Pseudonocardia acidicola]NMH98818.1 cytochrome P450 [Pseudonocardia acidicola]